ncbi:MAG TPA: sulfatase [Thermoleophilaceae bacterium]|nr:sulfatase [Thermoleophilaceae bacterium]
MNRTTRRGFLLAGGAAVAGAAAVGAGALESGGEERTRARIAEPGLRGDERPNVVILIVDTLRADHVYGDLARTPNMDELLASGLRFTRCFPEAMPTVPARNSLFTGRRMFPFRGWHDHPGMINSAGWEPFDHLDHSLPSVLRREGWWTAYVSDNPFFCFARGFRPFRRSFDQFIGKGGQLGTVAPLASVSERELRHWVHPATVEKNIYLRLRQYLANGNYQHDEGNSWSARVYGAAARLLGEAARRREPFAMVVDTYEPHEPWTPPRKYIDLYGDPGYHGPEPSKPPYLPVDSYLNDDNREFVLDRMRALYRAELTLTDRWLGVFLDRLDALRTGRDTLVVLMGDHGFQFGEHGWTGKIASQLHPPLTRVPLVVVDRERRRAGEASRQFASPHDVAPTLLQLAGVSPPRAMNGFDLSPLLAGRRPRARPFTYGGYANSFYARTDRWALTAVNDLSNMRLYDLRDDPSEHHNLAAVRSDVVDRLWGEVERRTGGNLPVYRR